MFKTCSTDEVSPFYITLLFTGESFQVRECINVPSCMPAVVSNQGIIFPLVLKLKQAVYLPY